MTHEIIVDREDGSVLLPLASRPRRPGHASHGEAAALRARLSRADARERAFFRSTRASRDGNAAWQPYAALPAITALTNGSYAHAPRGIAISNTGRRPRADSTTPRTWRRPARSPSTSLARRWP